jgi:hypothetical protein
MKQAFAAVGRSVVVCAAVLFGVGAFLCAAGKPALAQDPEPPTLNIFEADVTIGAMPFTPGQTFSHDVTTAIPDFAHEVFVSAHFACSLISGQSQDGELVTWTIWTPVVTQNGPNKASFQSMMWCAPGQLTTNQVLGWLPISSASRSVFVRLDNTDAIPWDNTQSVMKIVSYR